VPAAVTAVVGAMGAPIKWERFPNLSGSRDGQPREDVPSEVRAAELLPYGLYRLLVNLRYAFCIFVMFKTQLPIYMSCVDP
jgi:hypothetical protein